MLVLFDEDRPPAELTAALLRRGAAMEIRARVWRGMAGLAHMREALHELDAAALAEADRFMQEEGDG